jgi:hypothetical protein
LFVYVVSRHSPVDSSQHLLAVIVFADGGAPVCWKRTSMEGLVSKSGLHGRAHEIGPHTGFPVPRHRSIS